MSKKKSQTAGLSLTLAMRAPPSRVLNQVFNQTGHINRELYDQLPKNTVSEQDPSGISSDTSNQDNALSFTQKRFPQRTNSGWIVWDLGDPSLSLDPTPSTLVSKVYEIMYPNGHIPLTLNLLLTQKESGLLSLTVDRPAQLTINGVPLGLCNRPFRLRLPQGQYDVNLRPINASDEVFSYSIEVIKQQTTRLKLILE